MIATHSQTTSHEEDSFPNFSVETKSHAAHPENETNIATIESLNTASQFLLPSRIVSHNQKAGLNPLVDAAGYLFSVLGKLKQLKSYRRLSTLQQELIQEINAFQENVKKNGYNVEYIVVCRYVICATFDDIIANTTWGNQGNWESQSLLAAYNQDTQHQDKFFTIMERTVKEPALYIDLMELMYLCLSMGYKGQYRSTEHSQYQLEQITNNLYKHIRAYRGSFSKTLSPTPLKTTKQTKHATKNKTSLLFILVVTACVIMAIFIGLGYLMDVISNEAYKNIAQIQTTVPYQTS